MGKYKTDAIKEARLEFQVKQFEKENENLRKHVFSLQGEVYGARLAAKYLDKELAGRLVWCVALLVISVVYSLTRTLSVKK